jgi:hypothetical protein
VQLAPTTSGPIPTPEIYHDGHGSPKKCTQTCPTSKGPHSFASMLSNVASMPGGPHNPDPLMKQLHRAALHLICLQKDKFGDFMASPTQNLF